MSVEGVDPHVGGEGGGTFHLVQPLRDPASNWAVDLAKNLEEYLLKICSGEISGGNGSHLSVNFAEAALLLQGSIQVYSRKVEYLYSLVLQALEFISQKRVQAEEEDQTSQTEASTSRPVNNKDDDEFWCSDDIPVDAKNHLLSSKEGLHNRLIKPPANLVVLEGDCLDSNGDSGELETYLLATSDLYRDFILLDPCDATTVDDFLRGIVKETLNGVQKGSALPTKSRKSFMSPLGPSSGGTARKSSARKNNKNIDEPLDAASGFESKDNGVDPDPAACNVPQESNFEFPMDDHYSESGSFDDSDSDEEDPWKPLNPHEPGNLKMKPFRKVKFRARQTAKRKPSIAAEFPLARPDRPINPLFQGVWEMLVRRAEKQQASEPPSYFEKLRQTLLDGAHETHGMFDNPEKDDVNKGFDGVFEEAGIDMEGAFGMDEDDDLNQERDDDFLGACDDATNMPEDPSSQATLEDLCRAHLDSLLASIAESEQQTELVARVTSWKQRIEQNLEEQDSRPPFDIHEYGERVIEKFTLDDSEYALPFTDIVKGQEKHEVTRTFSAMLQLVNDGRISLDKPGSSASPTCYTAANPFYVRCLSRQTGHREKQFPQSKKRHGNSPLQRGRKEAEEQPPKSSADSPQQGGKFRVKKLGVPKIGRCTPESKRRRRSRLADPNDTYSNR